MADQIPEVAIVENLRRIGALEAQNARLRAREQSIAKALGVCDGGEYVNDIVAAVERSKAELAKLQGDYAELWAERNGWQARAENAERELAVERARGNEVDR